MTWFAYFIDENPQKTTHPKVVARADIRVTRQLENPLPGVPRRIFNNNVNKIMVLGNLYNPEKGSYAPYKWGSALIFIMGSPPWEQDKLATTLEEYTYYLQILCSEKKFKNAREFATFLKDNQRLQECVLGIIFFNQSKQEITSCNLYNPNGENIITNSHHILPQNYKLTHHYKMAPKHFENYYFYEPGHDMELDTDKFQALSITKAFEENATMFLDGIIKLRTVPNQIDDHYETVSRESDLVVMYSNGFIKLKQVLRETEQNAQNFVWNNPLVNPAFQTFVQTGVQPVNNTYVNPLVNQGALDWINGRTGR